MSSSKVHRADVFANDHPALAGHFPGEPIVPGVLILARVMTAARERFGYAIAAIKIAKFHEPLKPDERFVIDIEPSRDALAFEVRRGPARVASGILQIANATPR